METEARSDSRLSQILRRGVRLFNPLARPLAGKRFFPLWAVLTHTGRRSGHEYRTPIVARHTPDGFVIPMPFGPGTQWVQNLRAAGGGRLRWKGADYDVVDPEIIDQAEAGPAFNAAMRAGIRLFGINTFVRVRRRPPGEA